MEILKIVSFALAALFIFLLFKDKRSDIAVLVSLLAGVILFVSILTSVTDIINFIKEISSRANIDIVYIGVVLKILAISYLATFCSEICKDAGAASIASKVEFSAKILILTLAIPILMAVLQSYFTNIVGVYMFKKILTIRNIFVFIILLITFINSNTIIAEANEKENSLKYSTEENELQDEEVNNKLTSLYNYINSMKLDIEIMNV